MAALIYTDAYGEVTRAQLAAYRKRNVTPVDHGELVRVFGDDRQAIIRAVWEYTGTGGFNLYTFMQDHR